MKKQAESKKERPHPMLHGQHEGKMPHMAKKEPLAHHDMSPDQHHKAIGKHLKHLRDMAKKGYK